MYDLIVFAIHIFLGVDIDINNTNLGYTNMCYILHITNLWTCTNMYYKFVLEFVIQICIMKYVIQICNTNFGYTNM